MDKRVIFSVAGSGKTSYIVDNLTDQKRSLIVTYTNANFENLQKKILERFNGEWPENIRLFTYFEFLFSFCFKPFLSDISRAKGITFERPSRNYAKSTEMAFYMDSSRRLYSCRLSSLLIKMEVINSLKQRLETFFDEFVIDEIQDVGGRDFNFLKSISDANIRMLYVGDFFQHTYTTSSDGNVNQHLFDDKRAYEKQFSEMGFEVDSISLKNSWRCSPAVCEFISRNLGIEIGSNWGQAEGAIVFLDDLEKIRQATGNGDTYTLHYQKGREFGIYHKNWGESKGEDNHFDVCVALNKTTYSAYLTEKLFSLPNSTKNKLYVAITRARRNVYLFDEQLLCDA